MKALLVVGCVAILVPACTTVREASNEERARCESMRAQMGTQPRHSHGELKGTVAQTPMNREHHRCRALLNQR